MITARLHLNGDVHEYDDTPHENGNEETFQTEDRKNVVIKHEQFQITDYETENAYMTQEEEKPKTVIKSENEMSDVGSLYCHDESSMHRLNMYTNTDENQQSNAKDTEENEKLQYVKKEEEITIEYGVSCRNDSVKNEIVDGK